MPELVARGPETANQWRKELPEGIPVRLGRSPQAAGWEVPWDTLISRDHADLLWQNGLLRVTCVERARNPIYYHGQISQEFKLALGEFFQIGKTRFELTAPSLPVDDNAQSVLMEERSFRLEDLTRFEFENANHRLEVLSTMPQVMLDSHTDEGLAIALVKLLLRAMPHADTVSVVQYRDYQKGPCDTPDLMRWESRSVHGSFRPSRKLILQALKTEQSRVHVWDLSDSGRSADSAEFTYMGSSLDWAFCTPVLSEACRGWVFYVSGKVGRTPDSPLPKSTEDLRGDMRFSQLVAQFVAAARQINLLQNRTEQFKGFIDQRVVNELVGSQAGRALIPREGDITVLFCDVRGFSRRAEQQQHDLYDLLNRVSEALGVMTGGIKHFEGNIADFQGDAAVGFWGWPVALADGPIPACRAALMIHEAFRSARGRDNPLADFRVGIGIAHGRAIAGHIGTAQLAKVGVFGPVVNLCSRLEGMTKKFQAPIIIDESTAQCVRQHLDSSVARCRRLARIKPVGMETSQVICELLPPDTAEGALSNQNIADYEAALDAFNEGEWSKALELLDRLPVRDRAKDFLTVHIAQNGYEPPNGWNGVVTMQSK